jgi:hypothetical protein
MGDDCDGLVQNDGMHLTIACRFPKIKPEVQGFRFRSLEVDIETVESCRGGRWYIVVEVTPEDRETNRSRTLLLTHMRNGDLR